MVYVVGALVDLVPSSSKVSDFMALGLAILENRLKS